MLVRLRAIGECGIDVGAAHVGPDAEVAFALLLVLALAGGHTVARRRLTDLLWPCTPEDRARHNLRQTLYKLRQLGAPVESESLHVWLPASAIVPHPLLDGDGDGDGAAAAELLRPDRPFGEFLAGYAPTFSAPFSAWLDEQRSVIHARLRRAALTRLHDERRRGSWAAVETLARRVLQLDALNEEATLALAEATVMTGSKRAAIAQLDAYLRDLGPDAGDIRPPAALLRRRIAERLPPSLSPPDGDPCFVGREESMAFLHDQFRHVRAGGARTVLVWGDAGIGKSRLTTEFARLAVMEGAQLARVGCQARDVERPLAIFVDVVPHLLGLPGAIGCSPESMTYLRRLTSHDPTAVEPPTETRDAELLFAYVRRSIFDLVDAVAAEAPLLLVFEDVHWLDEQSWRVLRELLGWLERRRVLVVLTSRHAHATPTRPTRPAPGVVEHRLGPLGREASLALFDAATPGGRVPAEYREWCVQVADGNPLFVCELAAYWTATKKLKAPRALHELIDARITELTADSLRVLQAAAVLGEYSSFDNMEIVLDIPRRDLLTCLDALSARDLLGGSGTVVCCKHVLIRDAALRTLCDATRRMLYRCKAEALSASLGRNASSSSVWALAEAWLECGDRARALELVLSCGIHLQAVGLADEAADVLERAAATELAVVERVAVMRGLSAALEAGGQWERLLSATGRYRAAMSASPHKHDLAVARLRAAWHVSGGRNTSRVLKALTRYSVSAAAPSSVQLSAAALGVAIADNCCLETQVHEFADVLRRIAVVPRREQRTSDECMLIYHTSRGDLDHAVALASAIVEHDRAHDTPIALARTLRIASVPFRRAGNHGEAEDVAREAFVIADRAGARAQVLAAVEAMGYVLLDDGRVDEAEAWSRHADQVIAAHGGHDIPLGISALQVRIALERRDRVPLERMIAIGATSTSDPIVRRRALLLALRTHSHLHEDPASIGTEELSALASAFECTASWGGQDYCAWVLQSALTAADREHDARRLIARYLSTQRRERFAPPARLVTPP